MNTEIAYFLFGFAWGVFSFALLLNIYADYVEYKEGDEDGYKDLQKNRMDTIQSLQEEKKDRGTKKQIDKNTKQNRQA